MISGRPVSISSRSENEKSGALRGASADSWQGPRTKVKTMPRKTISEKKKCGQTHKLYY